MAERINKTVYSLLVSLSFLVICLWLSLRSVVIIAVHRDDNFSDVLVKNFPLTAKGKIKWWFANEMMLKSRFDIAKPASYGSYTISFWLFGDNYREGDPDEDPCFKEMKTKKNCIGKKQVFSVGKSSNTGIIFSAN